MAVSWASDAVAAMGNGLLKFTFPRATLGQGRVKTAGGADNTALDAIVDRMIDGDVFGNAQEAAAISSGWK